MNFAHSEVATLDPNTMRTLCEEYVANNYIDPETSERLGVKRGLRKISTGNNSALHCVTVVLSIPKISKSISPVKDTLHWPIACLTNSRRTLLILSNVRDFADVAVAVSQRD